MALKRDLIQRMIEQLAQALASILGLRKKGALDEAVAQVEQAAARLTGLDLRMLAGVDSASVAAMTQEPVKLLVLARLALERAEIESARGRADQVRGWRRRAVELWLEAFMAGASLDPDAKAAIAAETGEDLAPRYQDARRDALG